MTGMEGNGQRRRLKGAPPFYRSRFQRTSASASSASSEIVELFGCSRKNHSVKRRIIMKRKRWNPKVTINFVDFKSEAERERSYKMWADTIFHIKGRPEEEREAESDY